MPLLTFKQCIFCYKEDESIKKEGWSAVSGGYPKLHSNQKECNDNDNGPTLHDLNKNSEVCRRFCTMASRYYDLDPYFYNPQKTMKAKRTIVIDRACSACTRRLESFCDIYYQWNYMRMQLDWRANEILEVMEKADQDPVNVAMRNALIDKMKANEMSMDDLDDFRNELMDSIESRGRKADPKLIMNKKDMEQDPDFAPIRRKKKKRTAATPNKKKKKAPAKSAPAQSLPQKTAEVKGNGVTKTELGNQRKRARADSVSSCGSAASYDLDDLFVRVEVPVKKIPKLANGSVKSEEMAEKLKREPNNNDGDANQVADGKEATSPVRRRTRSGTKLAIENDKKRRSENPEAHSKVNGKTITEIMPIQDRPEENLHLTNGAVGEPSFEECEWSSNSPPPDAPTNPHLVPSVVGGAKKPETENDKFSDCQRSVTHSTIVDDSNNEEESPLPSTDRPQVNFLFFKPLQTSTLNGVSRSC